MKLKRIVCAIGKHNWVFQFGSWMYVECTRCGQERLYVGDQRGHGTHGWDAE